MLLTATGNTGVAVVPVLDVVLHVEVVDEQRVPQFGVTDGLIQGESWRTCKNDLFHRNLV